MILILFNDFCKILILVSTVIFCNFFRVTYSVLVQNFIDTLTQYVYGRE